MRKILLLQEFDITIKDKKESENVIADHLSRLPWTEMKEENNKGEINEQFQAEKLMRNTKSCQLISYFTPQTKVLTNFQIVNAVSEP